MAMAATAMSNSSGDNGVAAAADGSDGGHRPGEQRGNPMLSCTYEPAIATAIYGGDGQNQGWRAGEGRWGGGGGMGDG
ncbi:hypothetical protein NL676_018077 [Syzygium grande]|nr:hypothetical protein NL676_018077 [Syzygium grande]